MGHQFDSCTAPPSQLVTTVLLHTPLIIHWHEGDECIVKQCSTQWRAQRHYNRCVAICKSALSIISNVFCGTKHCAHNLQSCSTAQVLTDFTYIMTASNPLAMVYLHVVQQHR